ncbi:MAG: peptide/nickel transport system substrate-binding protein [Thermomicrobiales bacterium]|nr:peptide/nickel transport system substrate-binding protein [Thermomicrobiales bacterium]
MSRESSRTPSIGREVDALLAEWAQGRLSRRSVLRRAAALGLSVPALAMLVGHAGPGRAAASVLRAAQEDPSAGKPGGTLRVATIGEPPHLDEHQSTAELIAVIGYCAYEGLFTYDAQYQPIPELVETHTVSADGLTHTMALRQGVTFHNGEPLTAADAIASVQRWGRISGVGKRLIEKTKELAQVDERTIEFRLTEPYGTILIALAHNTQACTIHPKSVLDAAGDEPITDAAQYVGTGPYKLAEWQRDAAMRFERFDGYQSAAGDKPVGYGGKKYAYADTIEFIPVPDEAARVAGLQAGDYHLALDVGNDQYEVLKDSPGVVAEILTPTNWDVFFLNWKSPMMGNLAMRQAVQAALDHKPMLQSGRGGDEFIRLDPGLMMQQTPWYTTAGQEHYDVKNPDLAKQKLQEAGYDGAPLRFMTTQEYSYMYGESIVAKQQLEAAGITVDLQVIDWATVLERRAKPEEWDMFSTGHGFVPDPSQISYVGQMNQYPGWWSSESSLALAAQLLAESDFDTRKGIFEQIQTAHYTEIPAIKIGDSSLCSFRSDKVGGWDPQFERGVKYWNLWINE